MKKNILLGLLLSCVLFTNNFAMEQREPIQRKRGSQEAGLLDIKDMQQEERIDFSKFSQNIKNQITDVMINNFLSIHKDITKLNLKACINIENIDFSKCPKLIDLNLKDCKAVSDDTLDNLSKNCPLLQSINLSNCRSVTDEGLIELIERCPNLKYIKLKNCDSLTDQVIYKFIEKSKNLEYINLKDCDEISESALLDLKNALGACSIVNTDGTEFLGITTISFENTEDIDDDVLDRVSQNYPFLNNIDLDNCSNIRNKGVIKISKRCHFLQSITLKNCAFLTNKVIYEFIKNNKDLKYIDLTSCDGISKKAILKLQEEFPDCTIKY